MSSFATVIPNVPPQFFDNDGEVAAGYKLFTYEAGTTTKLATYQDAEFLAANTNPIVLDASGRASIYLEQTVGYKFVLAPPGDTDPPTSPIWTRDDVYGIPATLGESLDVTGTAGENMSANRWAYLSDGSGGKTVGRWYLTDADFTYASTRAGMIGFNTSGAVTAGDTAVVFRVLGKITSVTGVAGSLYYLSATSGQLTTSAPTNARPVAIADSDGSFIIVNDDFANYVDASVVKADSATITTETVTTSTIGTLVVSTAASSAVPWAFKAGAGAGYAAKTDGVLYQSSVPKTTVGTAEEFFHSFTVPGATFNGTGRAIVVEALLHTAANANAKVATLYFGATSIAFYNTNGNNTQQYLRAFITDLTATTQRMVTIATLSSANANGPTITVASPAETASGDIVLRMSLTDAVAAGDQTIDYCSYRFQDLKTS